MSSDLSRGFHIFFALTEGGEAELGQNVLQDLLDSDGRVRFKSIGSFHDYIRREYGFRLERNGTGGVLPGGRHLFYVNGNVLLRVKTSGTAVRPRPHMTLSSAVGLGWNDEVQKFSRYGDVVPKEGNKRAGSNWRALARIGTTEDIEAADDQWAQACHFDFVRGFDASGAAALPLG